MLLSPRRPSLAPEVKPGKPPQGVDYVGLDSTKQHLCFCAASKDVRDTLRLQRAMLRQCGDVCVHTDLVDVQAYVFHASVLDVLAAKPAFSSLRRDLLPYLVRKQFELPRATAGQAVPATPTASSRPESTAQPSTPATPPPRPSPAPPLPPPGPFSTAEADGERRVSVLLAEPGAYVARCDSLRAYLEINRELASPTEAGHLHGFQATRHENFLGHAVELGGKAVVGPGCIVGFASRVGDKASVKRSVVGRRCRLGSGVKVVNSVLHDDVTLEEGATVAGSVLGKGAVVQAGASLRDCQVSPGFVIAAGSEHRNVSL